MTKQDRINARLPEDVARQLEVLERMHGLTTTGVVMESIRRYYAASTEGTGPAAAILERAGFIGVSDGPADLSSDYKAQLVRSLDAKT